MIYSANYSLKEPQKNVDLADVNDLNYNTEAIDGLIHNTQISLAPAFDQTLTYNVGDLVMYENLLYKCITAITVAEAWDSTKWERAYLSDSAGGGSGNANVTELTYNQYLALSQAEKTNGTTYMVTDDPNDSSSGGGGGGGSSENYSYTEQTVGTWVDGSTIYKKTIHFETPISISSSGTDLSDSYFSGMNIEQVIRAEIVVPYSSGSGMGTSPINFCKRPNNQGYKVYVMSSWDNVEWMNIWYTKSTS